MNRYSSPLILCLSLLLFSSGCVTAPTREVEPLTARELQAFFDDVQDARSFWLTQYESERGPVFRGGHRLHTDKYARLEFPLQHDLPAPSLGMQIRQTGDRPALIDTSSRVSWMEYGLAINGGLIPIGPPPIRRWPEHVEDPVPGFLSVASNLRIGDLRMDAALFYVKGAHGPLEKLYREKDQLAAPVVLGCEFIHAFHFFQIDFYNRMVFLSTTNPYQPDENRLIAEVPLQDYYGTIAVEGEMDGVSTPFLLDSLGSYGIASTLYEGETVRQVSIGDLVLRNVAHTPMDQLNLGDTDFPRIGLEILQNYVVTFDNRRRRIYFEKPVMETGGRGE